MNAIEAEFHIAAATIRLAGVSKNYQSMNVIRELDVEFKAGDFTVVLGPSGCGKSTLLQMIAGLERVSGGKILIGDREIQDLEPKERGCAMVFQNYALYPHMTVFDNIAYSLKIAGISKRERRDRVDVVAKMLGLTDYLHRKPRQLSGGQRQRVAIGRAIVREPAVLLFDEPLSNLDAQLRHDTRIELAELHRRIGATTVFVTHDQVEAMTLADQILILNKGEIEQYGTPQEIYHHPASVFVAKFIGSPPMNIFPVKGDGTVLRLADGQVVANSRLIGQFQLGIRPEDISIEVGAGASGIKAQIRYREDLGSHSILAVGLCSETVRIATQFGSQAPESHELELFFPLNRLHLFDAQTGKTVSDAFEAPSEERS
jgi:sn-glycerol 3-phosphate transport system ATP-binding protein